MVKVFLSCFCVWIVCVCWVVGGGEGCGGGGVRRKSLREIFVLRNKYM